MPQVPQHPGKTQQGLGAPQAQSNPYVTANAALVNAQAQQAQAGAQKAQMEAQILQQGLGTNPNALLSEAQSTYSDINMLTEQVDGGVREAVPALQQAQQRFQQILGEVDANPAIDNNQFQEAMMAPQQVQQAPQGLGGF